MLDFPGEKNGDFSYLKNSNIEYGGGGPQEHGISQILQPIVRKIELGVKWADARNLPNNFWPRLSEKGRSAINAILYTWFHSFNRNSKKWQNIGISICFVQVIAEIKLK